MPQPLTTKLRHSRSESLFKLGSPSTQNLRGRLSVNGDRSAPSDRNGSCHTRRLPCVTSIVHPRQAARRTAEGRPPPPMDGVANFHRLCRADAYFPVMPLASSASITACIHSRARLSSFSRSSGVSACSASRTQSRANSSNSLAATASDSSHRVPVRLPQFASQRRVPMRRRFAVQSARSESSAEQRRVGTDEEGDLLCREHAEVERSSGGRKRPSEGERKPIPGFPETGVFGIP